MGAGSDDVYGGSQDAQPAVAGSYGIPPTRFRLPDATRLGGVRLRVADLARSVRYYTRVLGLHVVDDDGHVAHLAPHGASRVLVTLEEHAGAGAATRRAHLGLFHFAILLPDRPALGRFVRHLADIGERAGAGDHLVSEAFYLTDPDGLGIEVYADRPRETWMRVGRELVMATDPVDMQGLVRDAGDAAWDGMPAGTVMGHVHLHVGDIAQADAFFREALGFDVMTRRYPGALFLGAGGYHHHVGTNTWAGPKAMPPRDDDAQLLAWAIELPDETGVSALRANVEAAGHATSMHGDGAMETRDPWGTRIVVRVGT
jgi:catechol 2,3-dioxygenase